MSLDPTAALQKVYAELQGEPEGSSMTEFVILQTETRTFESIIAEQ